MKNKPKLFSIILILVFISAVALWISHDYFYELKDISVEKVMSLLINYAVIAALIERFSNKIVLSKSYLSFVHSTKFLDRSDVAISEIPSLKVDDELTSDALKLISALKEVEDHNNSFTWLSFFLALMIASFGFRFFANVFQVSGGVTINFIVDVFLTSIFLSGGAQYIMSIIKLLKQ